MKPLFYSCWFVLLAIYFGMKEYSHVTVVQSVLSPMDVFLALAVPVGFAKSTISYVKGGHITLKGTQYLLGFLLVFTLSQLLHSGVGRVTSDALDILQDPPIEDAIAKLVDQSLFESSADQRFRAAALLYTLSGVRTMYKSEDNTHVIFKPNESEKEQFRSWKNTKHQEETVRQQLRDQAQAITTRSFFHLASFFILFSATLLFEVRRANRNIQSVENGS